MIAFVFVLAICLWTIFAPRDWLLFGSRWQLKNGDQAEPSDEYVVLTRIGGVIGAVIAVVLLVSVVIEKQEEEKEQAIADTWGTSTIQLPELTTQIRLSDEALDGKDRTVQQIIAEARKSDIDMQVPTSYGVVGSANADPVVDVVDAANGDLVVSVRDTLLCEPDHMVVQEDPHAVHIAIVYKRSPSDDLGWNGGIDPKGCLYDDAPVGDWSEPVELVHVPLDKPLGDREVLDLETGDPLTPVG